MQSFGAILLIAAYFCYSLTALLLYFLIGDGIPITLAFGIQNMIIVALLMLRFMFVKKRITRPKKIKLIFMRSLTGVVYSLCYFSALSYSSFAEVGVLTNSFPLFIVLIAWLFLGERVSAMQWGALLFGMVGVWVILIPQVHDIWNAGIFYATMASIFWAISLIIMQKVTDYEDIYHYLLFFFSFTLILLAPFIIHYFQMPTPRQMFFFMVASLVSLLAQSLTFKAYKICSAAELAPYNFSFAFFHFLLAKGLFSFQPSINFYIGAGMIFFGGVVNFILFERRTAITHDDHPRVEPSEVEES